MSTYDCSLVLCVLCED